MLYWVWYAGLILVILFLALTAIVKYARTKQRKAAGSFLEILDALEGTGTLGKAAAQSRRSNLIVADLSAQEASGKAAAGGGRRGSETGRFRKEAFDAYLNASVTARSEGNYWLVVDNLRRALKLNPPIELEIPVAFDMFETLKELGQFDKAVDFLEQYGAARANTLQRPVRDKIKLNIQCLEVLRKTYREASRKSIYKI